MKIKNKFLLLLIKYRVTISLLFLFAMMASGFLVAAFLGSTGSKSNISQYIPTGMLLGSLLLLLFYVTTGVIKSKLVSDSVDIGKDETEVIESYDKALAFGSQRLRIAFACWGSFILFMLIVMIVTIVLGFEENLGGILWALIFIGPPIWFLSTWQFFSRKLA